CYRRSESIVPQQVLALANSPLAVAQARLTAATLSESAASDDKDDDSARFVERAFELVLSRAPSSDELRECLRFLEEQTAVLAANANAAPATSTAASPEAKADAI